MFLRFLLFLSLAVEFVHYVDSFKFSRLRYSAAYAYDYCSLELRRFHMVVRWAGFDTLSESVTWCDRCVAWLWFSAVVLQGFSFVCGVIFLFDWF